MQSSTIGLVTLNEMKAKQDTVIKQREQKIAQKKAEKEQKKQEELEAKRRQAELQKKQIKSLSFFDDEQDEEDEDEEEKHKEKDKNEHEEKDKKNEENEAASQSDDSKVDSCKSDPDSSQDRMDEQPARKKKKIGKNPDVDTSFLPDRDREEEENRLREKLRQVSEHCLN